MMFANHAHPMPGIIFPSRCPCIEYLYTSLQYEPFHLHHSYHVLLMYKRSWDPAGELYQSASPLAPFVQRYKERALRLALCSSHSVGLEPRTLYSVERSTLRKFFYFLVSMPCAPRNGLDKAGREDVTWA